ncbi:hypothetical protein BCR33DRAFT_717142 [Rhizoclosmatium globosum]|uniref:Uncharacterized protein n=1 Tax=Rhizoclosmatium globosum TaxID=329046 RepID=A0A1Y2CAG1_9FUNG|nr:hypothetical protein BCR33DRAFT_717142 [Rhizoclosmatium globosum]|eukprot:ORY44023.1 hypothetical protein BCR33DRAFT_717142 [Rhizoclosmatium globosum]
MQQSPHITEFLDLGHGNSISFGQVQEMASSIINARLSPPNHISSIDISPTSCEAFVQVVERGLAQVGPVHLVAKTSFSSILNTIRSALDANKVVLLELKFKSAGQHFLSIVPDFTDDGAFYRVVHAFQNNHSVRTANGDKAAQQRIFGVNTDLKPLGAFHINSYQTGLIPLSLQQKQFKEVLKELMFKMHPNRRMFAAGISAGSVTFALTLAAVLIENNKLKSAGEKAGIVVGQSARAAVGEGNGGCKSGNLCRRQCWCKTVIKNAAKSGAAFTGVVTAIDLVNGAVHYAIGKSSIVEFRKDAASNLGGAVGGFAGYIGATAAAAALMSNPVGWGVIGVGFVGGMVGAKAVDESIWSSELDSLEHLFWYFKLGNLILCAVGLKRLSMNVEERLTYKLPTEDTVVVAEYRRGVMGQYLMLLQLCCPDYFGAMSDISEVIVQQSEI